MTMMIEYEWDEEKAAQNLTKHGVSFDEAIEVFSDPNAIEFVDDSHSLNETRMICIGYSTKRVLFVVFVERDANIVRLISAREPTPTERDLYEGNN